MRACSLLALGVPSHLKSNNPTLATRFIILLLDWTPSIAIHFSLVQRLLSKQAHTQSTNTYTYASCLCYWLVGLFNLDPFFCFNPQNKNTYSPSSSRHLTHKHIQLSILNSPSSPMDCLVLPVSLIRRRSTASRLGYRPLTNDDGFDESEGPVTVLVGKERRVFLVDPFVLQEYPFRLLIHTMSLNKDQHPQQQVQDFQRPVVFVDVDAILFEHMLWLLHNDSSSLFKLNLKEIIEFYAQDN